ncbi:hypothetical protein PBT90_04240 [Algoriphagus halophytocola]|uniref:Lipocalin-like domain-containing protein n=1 Tax=Algoriphagus halophytocola TaxID=2991499 RepID=A0ABY6MJN0_9BACT|nr:MULTISPECIES: hypothetical protein [unclassified Algoriphagus]UZD22627.1 hypothetical protein OM944_18500 [Algoriphagus sp. TR-M5]WBL43893.1 hypothetical protein PBT90_04240 [Algoriphagus sp. TR-M9]
MLTKILYPSTFTLIAGLYFTFLSLQESPVDLMLGEWQEVSWEYEKLDSLHNKGEGFDIMVTDHIKEEISKNLVIHKAETWKFYDSETLEMEGQNTHKELHWTLKGRGNILQIGGSGEALEYYEIQELSADHMVLHFSFDMQVRGIMKMTFKRIQS